MRKIFAIFEMRGIFKMYEGVSEWACGAEWSEGK